MNMTEQQKQMEAQRRLAQQIGQMVIDQIATGVEVESLRAQLEEAKKTDAS